tara:strand:+ start:38 stop:511 length:474 start_codon:yes stop_codon:yes gene_type:complete
MSRLYIVCVLLSFAAGLGLSKLISPPIEEAPKFHKYDVNQDGIVSQLDVLHIINYLNNQQANKSEAMKSSEVTDEITKEDLSNIMDIQSKIVINQIKLLQNQTILSVGQLRIHHFMEPHSDFYPMCPECQKDKQEIYQDKNKTIKHPRQDSNLQPTD